MGILMRNEINYSGSGSSSPSTATSLSDLTDVEITSLANGQGLFYNEELQKWINEDVTSGGATTGTLKPWLYSEEETIIGNYLGKPLYRKVISVPGVVELTQQNNIYFAYFGMTTSLGLELGTIINASGTILRAQDGFETTRYAFPFTDTWNKESLMYLHWFPTGLKIESQIDQSQSGIIFSDPIFTVEYIKDSDEEGSGNSLMPYGVGGGSSLVNYSTEEQIIGTWIDGKTLYQKTIYIESLPNYSSIYLAYDDYDEVISITGFARHKESLTWSIPLPYTNDSGQNIIIDISTEDTSLPTRCIRIMSPNVDRSNMYGYVTIQYTKTTDSTT